MKIGELPPVLKMPDLHQRRYEASGAICKEVEENFLDPLVFQWDEDRLIVSKAIQNELAQFNADY